MNILHFMQHATTALIINFTGFRQSDAAGAAVQQLHLQLIFQFRDGLADGRDAHLQLPGGGGKRAKFDHFGKHRHAF